jgi:hypothetical protein
MLIWMGMYRHRLWHEADLDVRLDISSEIGVEDAVNDRPVVYRVSFRVFGISVGAAPF